MARSSSGVRNPEDEPRHQELKGFYQDDEVANLNAFPLAKDRAPRITTRD